MGAYRLLFSIAVEHLFFPDGVCPSLDFVPPPKTAMLLRKAGLLIRSMKNGLCIFFDETRTEALQRYSADPEESWSIGFNVFSKDPSFENYTQPSLRREEEILYFDGRKGKADADGRFRLHGDASVSETNFEKLNSPRLQDLLSKKERLVRPMFVVDLPLARKKKGRFGDPFKADGPNCYLKFKARETVWKYYLVGEMGKKNSYIADLDHETEFEFSGKVLLPENRTAAVFRSKAAIPLQEKSNRRFQLREKGSGGERFLFQGCRRHPQITSIGRRSMESK